MECESKLATAVQWPIAGDCIISLQRRLSTCKIVNNVIHIKFRAVTFSMDKIASPDIFPTASCF